MALNMDAAVKIRATVDGLTEILGLNKALGGTEKQAKETSGALGKLRAATSGLSGALGGLVPAVGIAGLAALGKRSIDAADNLNDLSQRTGVGVENLSKFGAAAADSGSSIEEVSKAMGRLSKGITQNTNQNKIVLETLFDESQHFSSHALHLRGSSRCNDIAPRILRTQQGPGPHQLQFQWFRLGGHRLSLRIGSTGRHNTVLLEVLLCLISPLQDGADVFLPLVDFLLG